MLKIILKTLILILLFQSIAVAREINIDKLIDQAKSSNKHLFVFLHKTGCGYCKNMRDFTLDDNAIKKMIEKKFLFVHININEHDNILYKNFKGDGQAFAKYVGYDFYPTSLFFDDVKDISYAVPGYRDEKFFNVILHYVDSKSYQKINFRKYKENFDFNKKL